LNAMIITCQCSRWDCLPRVQLESLESLMETYDGFNGLEIGRVRVQIDQYISQIFAALARRSFLSQLGNFDGQYFWVLLLLPWLR
jgi:hypothetical protein